MYNIDGIRRCNISYRFEMKGDTIQNETFTRTRCENFEAIQLERKRQESKIELIASETLLVKQ